MKIIYGEDCKVQKSCNNANAECKKRLTALISYFCFKHICDIPLRHLWFITKCTFQHPKHNSFKKLWKIDLQQCLIYDINCKISNFRPFFFGIFSLVFRKLVIIAINGLLVANIATMNFWVLLHRADLFEIPFDILQMIF